MNKLSVLFVIFLSSISPLLGMEEKKTIGFTLPSAPPIQTGFNIHSESSRQQPPTELTKPKKSLLGSLVKQHSDPTLLPNMAAVSRERATSSTIEHQAPASPMTGVLPELAQSLPAHLGRHTFLHSRIVTSPSHRATIEDILTTAKNIGASAAHKILQAKQQHFTQSEISDIQRLIALEGKNDAPNVMTAPLSKDTE